MFFSSEAFDIQDAWENLINTFSPRNVESFLAATWLGESFTSVTRTSLERLVYMLGDAHEVYTEAERLFIPQVDDIIILREEPRREKAKTINCAIIAVDLSNSKNALFDFLFVMKLSNKALGGYNFFVAVDSEQIILGSTQTRINSNIDCQVAYPIRQSINWEALSEALLYRQDDGNFSSYYRGITSLLASVILCYDHREKEDRITLSNYDAFSTWNQLQSLGQSLYSDEIGNEELYEDYLAEVTAYQEALSFVRSTKVNALELLFAAEKAETEAEKTAFSGESPDVGLSPEESRQFEEMLNDPVALIRKMKQEQKRG